MHQDERRFAYSENVPSELSCQPAKYRATPQERGVKYAGGRAQHGAPPYHGMACFPSTSMAYSHLAYTLIGIVIGYITHCLRNATKPIALPLPPGPKPPLLGNIHDLPRPGQLEYEVWTKHKDLYGPISSLTVIGQNIIINDADLAIELLEKRASLHSPRPDMVFAGEMCGRDNLMIFQPPERLRAFRRQFHAMIGTQAARSRFVPLQEVEVSRFLSRVLDRPDELLQHVRTEAAATILKLAYGYDIEPHKEDPLAKLAEDAMEHFSLASVAGAWVVDFMPARE